MSTANSSSQRSAQFTRRQALTTGALAAGAMAGMGYWPDSSTAYGQQRSANEKLNLAVIGIGGRGGANLNGVSGENIVALCDVDDQRAGKAYQRFNKARKFYDFRKLYDLVANEIDGVVISTPDHTHFHPAMIGMQLGKHCYCEKPMAHTLWEVRQMTKMAARQKVATQLGVQRHTIDNVHRVVELIKAGAIGEVTEVHSWIGGERGMPKVPTDRPAVPDHLKWDLWLGPADQRAYHPTIAPYGWRFWWDYGTGETGNWGCHILDIPFWALDLKYPTRVHGEGPKVHPLTTPKSMTTRMEFPAADGRGPVTLHWYHAKKGPEILRRLELSEKGNNTLFIGSKGMLLCGFSARKLLPEEKFRDFKAPAKSIPNSPGFYKEWITACKGGPAATCNFDYSGPLTETVLLGNVGYRAQGSFDWNAEKLQAGGNPQAQQLLEPRFRKGWEWELT